MHETSKAFLWSDNMSQHASCFIMSNTMRNKVPHADWMAKEESKMMAFSGPSTRVILSNFTFYFKKKKHVDVVKVQGCKLASRRKLLRL